MPINGIGRSGQATRQRPETDFLNRCLRCGECMKACPTGGLQLIWFRPVFWDIHTIS
ncbi:MAG: 4Fe-4S binding protein [Desulfovibrio fairfieldensis]